MSSFLVLKSPIILFFMVGSSVTQILTFPLTSQGHLEVEPPLGTSVTINLQSDMRLRERGDGRGRRGGEERRGIRRGRAKGGSSLLLTVIMQTHIHSIYTSTDLNHTHTHTLNTSIDQPFYGPGVSLRNEMSTLMWLSTDTLTLYATTSPTN